MSRRNPTIQGELLSGANSYGYAARNPLISRASSGRHRRLLLAGLLVYLAGSIGTSSISGGAAVAVAAIAVALSASAKLDRASFGIGIGSVLVATLVSAANGSLAAASIGGIWFGGCYVLGAAVQPDSSTRSLEGFVCGARSHLVIGLVLLQVGIAGPSNTFTATGNDFPGFAFRESLVLTSSTLHSAALGVLVAATASGRKATRVALAVTGVLVAVQSGYRIATLVAIVAGLYKVFDLRPSRGVALAGFSSLLVPFWWNSLSAILLFLTSPLGRVVPGLERTSSSGASFASQFRSLQGRTNVWQASFDAIQETSFSSLLVGDSSPLFDARRFSSLSSFTDLSSISAHNSILQQFSSAGILGVVAIFAGIAAARPLAKPQARHASLAIAALLVIAGTESAVSWTSIGTAGALAILLGHSRSELTSPPN